ncbi:hypothetical protein AXX17_AT1G03110 [Arabidopsis thaliana]|uniref:Uncharacterized protein n=1 Tax=Arabidopsis thaliana TaxID=3702 RepID=A0A178WH08_ARATH|nr:hypothetical protein AXX17_AT1G03110 [Arabidopsis thaliana]
MSFDCIVLYPSCDIFFFVHPQATPSRFEPIHGRRSQSPPSTESAGENSVRSIHGNESTRRVKLEETITKSR